MIADSCDLRLPAGRISIPYSTSAWVIVVMNTAEGSCEASQRRTIFEGEDLRASESTFVSSTIIWRVLEAYEPAHVAEVTVLCRRLEPCGVGSIRRDSVCASALRSVRPSRCDAPPPPWSALAGLLLRGAGPSARHPNAVS